MLHVPLVALDRTHHALRAEPTAAFELVVGASAFVLDEEVEGIEVEWATACSTGYCVGAASGTATLALAIKGLGITHGDEVIVPADMSVASALAVIHAGATPTLCDVLPGTELIDPPTAETIVTERTAAIIAVHLYGRACDMAAIGQFAARRHLAVIKDAAQARDATWEGRPCRSIGTVACFSLYPSKNLGARGDGGAVCTSDGALAARVRALRGLGQTRRGDHEVIGYNERLDGLHTEFFRVKLAHVDAANMARRCHAAAYRRAFEGHLELHDETPTTPCVYHLFLYGCLAGRWQPNAPRRVAYKPACITRQPSLGTRPSPAERDDCQSRRRWRKRGPPESCRCPSFPSPPPHSARM
jgi:dTDP-3-amino-3,4,6-trideoxy-alpha-D-glucose transaminase